MAGNTTGVSPLSRGLRPRWLTVSAAVVAVIAVQACPTRAFAQSGTWNSSNTTPTSWSTTARWSGGIVAGGTNNTATFTNGSTVTPLLLSNIVLGNLTTGASRVTIRSGTQTTNSLLTNEQIQFATATGTAPAITNTGRLDTFAIIAGSQGFTKSGAGALYLNRANTYTGTTTISAGDVRLAQNDGLGDSSAGNGTVIQSGAMLRLDNASTGVSGVQTAEAFTISGDGVGGLGALRSQAGTGNAFNGPITLAANASIKTNVALTLGGSINVGSSTLTLSDNGDFTVSGGFVGTSGTVSFTGLGAITLSGSSSFTGTTSVGNATGLVTMTGFMSGLMDFTPGAARTLAGTGTFNGGLSMGQNATLAPGVSDASTDYGTITTTTLNLINGTVALGIQDATTYDRLVMTAGSDGLTLQGVNKPLLTLDFANAITSGTLDLFSFTGLSGTFQGVSSTGVYVGAWVNSGDTWSLQSQNQTLTFSPSTGDLVVVPEPSTIALLGASLAAACLIRRRRQGTPD